jgi:hypothetical protein
MRVVCPAIWRVRARFFWAFSAVLTILINPSTSSSQRSGQANPWSNSTAHSAQRPRPHDRHVPTASALW